MKPRESGLKVEREAKTSEPDPIIWDRLKTIKDADLNEEDLYLYRPQKSRRKGFKSDSRKF